MFSKKVDCICGHPYSEHLNDKTSCTFDLDYFITCPCEAYDPAGHNPEQENFLCPQCRLVWMNRSVTEAVYYCIACNYIMLERQVKELMG